MRIMIRKVTSRDVKDVCMLVTELTGKKQSCRSIRNRISMSGTDALGRLFICKYGEQVAGFFGFRIRENVEEESRYGEVSVIVTRSDLRNKGIGQHMMRYAEKLARNSRCIGMWLVSGFGREQMAHKFYKGLGYKATGYRFIKKF